MLVSFDELPNAVKVRVGGRCRPESDLSVKVCPRLPISVRLWRVLTEIEVVFSFGTTCSRGTLLWSEAH